MFHGYFFISILIQKVIHLQLLRLKKLMFNTLMTQQHLEIDEKTKFNLSC